ncbi:type I polyketide synthase [Saccharothrix sp. NRRL B-16314]|uniref:type I polyketide synthase n=1 Tax=Saccharothrix sp. NRRL B-16314 TaxID=1463825 RepID=UPI00068FDA63|nr:type I polyketide synthase [Saccharothrix sp. NRRL B-16314]
MVGETSRQYAAEPVAVIGMSCRLPGAGDPEAFWRLLRDGVDAVTEVPEGRWPGLTEHRRGGFLPDVDRFDAGFFGISPNEAAVMDPQQRLALELAWEALENARLVATGLRGSATGVFVGSITQDYAAVQDRLGADNLGPHSYTGANRAMIANRVSYALGLRGPSLTLDTGQSSSLVAVQLACESLRRGETGLALAGGVNLNLLAETTASIGRFGALSPDGRCYTFDRRANGYVRGEGGALVVLKPLSDALRDGDVVHCVVLGGAVNNDGGGDGLTAPSERAQREVIETARSSAGVRSDEVQYVELHGTGTKVGDPIEAAALGAGRAATPLLVGSVKTNIGHLEGAAGVAGLLKVVLSLKHGELPPSLNFAEPNPEIPLDELGLRVPTAAGPWPRPDRPLVAGVSSFGMGGTNCHLVLGEAPAGVPGEPACGRPDLPWVLTARSAEALRGQAERLRAIAPAVEPAAVALSLSLSRAEFEHRAVILGEDRSAGLDALAAGRPDASVVTGTAVSTRCAFTFPGQGSQWPGMARALLDDSPEFAESIAACAEALAPFTDFSLVDVLRGGGDLDRVDVVQPALWAVMVSLARLWRSRGVVPDLVVGHSQGEIAAATVVGALTLSDGARVVALRSKAIAEIAGHGGMMSVATSPDVVESVVAEHAPEVTVAAVNGPRSVVVSGPDEALARLREVFERRGDRVKAIPVDYASHSVEVERIRDDVLAALAPIRPVSTDAVFVSTLTGEPVDTATLDADYWYRSLRRQVRFDRAVRVALDLDHTLFVECSPHPVLVAGVEETAEEAERDVAVVGTLRRGDGGLDRFRHALAEAYTLGAPVDWVGGVDVPRTALADLPTYAFQRERHWPGDAAPRPSVLSGRKPVVRSRRDLRDLVLTTTADVLGLSDTRGVLPIRTFKELGVDSAAAVDLRNRLRSATGLRLPTGLLFDHPTPDALVDRLHALSQDGPADQAVVVRPADDDPVVIVGMGCRYPGDVATPDDLWRLVSTGGDAITSFPTNRGWDLDALSADGSSGTSDTKHGGFLHDADRFDAALFGISPREATAMDPQQRLLLEVCWEAVERAGLDHAALGGSSTGVFLGAMAPDYGPRLHQPTGNVDGHLLTGTALSVVSGRIAYTLGLQGPAITVDTACSASLVAVHLAAQALRRGECDLALAGGATVMATPGMFVEFSRQGGLAPDGRCKAFGADADGTGWSEGAGVVVLERLSDARRRGHPVLAVVRGSAVNQDGRSNGMTAPNGPAQERVIRQALADAGLTPADVDAVEAHGTGTRLGDPIEAQALMAAYGDGRPSDRPLWLGSLKSNLGHTQAAAGVAGVIKMVKALEHRTLPRTLHADEPTGHVDWSGGSVRLLTEPVDLPADRPARAAVSSFGISGTNAHLILERAPEQVTGVVGEGPIVWTLSARTDTALRAQAARLHDFALAAGDDDLRAAGHALARRAAFEHRAVVVAEDREDLLAALAALSTGKPHPSSVDGVAAADVRPVFVFPGQGTQWPGMAVDLVESSEVFRDRLTACDAALAPHTGWSVLDALRGAEDAPGLDDGSDVIQPLLFAVMVSLAELWRSVGVEPAAVVGHSQGEITAACVAGVLTLEDAAEVVVLRAKALMTLAGTGGMASVSLSVEEVEPILAPWSDRLWIAVYNGPGNTVVAGDLDALEEFVTACGDRAQPRRVAIDYASHTPHVEVLRERLLDALARVRPRQTEIEFCSGMTGGIVPTEELTADYWYRTLRHAVRFQEAVRTLSVPGTPLFVEAGPHPVLMGHVQETLRDAGTAGVAVGSLRRDDGGWRRFLLAVGRAHVSGADVSWASVLGPQRPAPAGLPTYPFERSRYWLDGAQAADVTAIGLTGSPHPLLGAVVQPADGDGFLLTGRLSRAAAPWLADHTIDGRVLLPGTAFVDLALEAAAVAGCDEVAELTLEFPVDLPETGAVALQLVVGGADADGRRDLSVHSRPSDDPGARWTRHAGGVLAVAADVPVDGLAVWPPVDGVAVEVDDVYERLADQGYAYGPAFQGLTDAWRVGDDLYVEVALPEPVRADAGRFALHPALLDAALHLLVLGDPAHALLDRDSLLLPFSWSGVRVAAGGAEVLRVRIGRTGDDRVSLAVHDAAGNPIANVDTLAMRRIGRQGGGQQGGGQRSGVTPYAIEWADARVSDVDLVGQRWAVVGYDSAADDLCAVLGLAGVEAQPHYDLGSLADLTAGDVPGLIAVPLLPPVDDDVPHAARQALYQVLDLVQGFLGDDRFADSRLVFVTRGLSAGGVEGVVGASVWGMVRSAASEHPGRFGLVDVEQDFSEWATVAAALAAGETQVAVRGPDVVVPRLVRRAVDGVESTVDVSGTVLVTGGTGGLGALVSEHLVKQHGVRHLLLASRRGADAPGVEDLAARLRDLGAEVELTACDVSDRNAVARLVASVPADRPLTGVVHAAGVLDDVTVEGMSTQRVDEVFGPKADAAWHLHELTADLSLFVVFSSVAGVVGNAGQANYAAANMFLDGLAVHRHALGLPAVSVAWGTWESGMTGAMTAADTARLARSGITPLTAREGLDLFDHVLTASEPLVVAAKWDTAALKARTGELPSVLRGLVRGTPRRTVTATTAPVVAAGGLSQRVSAMADADARKFVLDLVRSHVAAVLAHPSPESVDVHREFTELGFDSLTAVELRNRLDAEVGTRLPTALAFDYPTITSLAEYLRKTIAPSATPPEDLLRATLDQIHGVLSDEDQTTRAKLVAILHSTLDRLGSALVPATVAEEVDGLPADVGAASDEEIFAFIDKQL